MITSSPSPSCSATTSLTLSSTSPAVTSCFMLGLQPRPILRLPSSSSENQVGPAPSTQAPTTVVFTTIASVGSQAQSDHN